MNRMEKWAMNRMEKWAEGPVEKAMRLEAELRESERKREELEAVLQDFLQGKDPKLAKKITPHWVPVRVVAVQTEFETFGVAQWVADFRGSGPIPPSLSEAFNSPEGIVQIATRIPTAIVRVGGKVLAEAEDLNFRDE